MLVWPCQSQELFISSWLSTKDPPHSPSSLTGQMRFLRNRPGPHSPLVFAVPTSVLACANLALYLRPLRSPSLREPFLPQGGGFRNPSWGSHCPWGPLLLLHPLYCTLSTCLCVFLPTRLWVLWRQGPWSYLEHSKYLLHSSEDIWD